jgi:hypothetical protein
VDSEVSPCVSEAGVVRKRRRRNEEHTRTKNNSRGTAAYERCSRVISLTERMYTPTNTQPQQTTKHTLGEDNVHGVSDIEESVGVGGIGDQCQLEAFQCLAQQNGSIGAT